jgi:proline iminopeptidase
MRSVFAVCVAAGLTACAAPPLREGFVPGADGIRLFYRSLGRGSDTVVVLHGGPGLHHAYLVDALRPLARGRTFLFYDQRARGRSDSVPDTLLISAERDVADLEAVRDHFGLARLTLVGHGWGGALAVRYALAHPDRVARMALISPLFARASHTWGLAVLPYGGPDSAAFEGLGAARLSGLDHTDPARFCRDYWGAYLSPTPVRDRFATVHLAPAMCDAPAASLARAERVRQLVFRGLGNWDWRTELGAVSAPVLVIQGRSPVWSEAATEWITHLPHAGLVQLEAHPQFPWLGDAPGFRGALERFLTRAATPSPRRAG